MIRGPSPHVATVTPETTRARESIASPHPTTFRDALRRVELRAAEHARSARTADAEAVLVEGLVDGVLKSLRPHAAER
jgi:hypothetical protein